MPKLHRNKNREDKPVMVPAGSADDPVDASADSAVHGTINTTPHSPLPNAELNDSQKQQLYADMNKPGASIAEVAEKYDVMPQQVNMIMDEINGRRKDK